MNEHLSHDEINMMLVKGKQSLSGSRYMHFENCQACQAEFSMQLYAHKALQSINLKRAPLIISQKVMKKISKIAENSVPKKTDWVFLIAVVTLFAIGSWVIFSGKIAEYLPGNITTIVNNQTEKVKEYKYIEEVKDILPSFSIDFKLPSENHFSTFILLGILAVLFYYLLDRKFGQLYRIKKT